MGCQQPRWKYTWLNGPVRIITRCDATLWAETYPYPDIILSPGHVIVAENGALSAGGDFYFNYYPDGRREVARYKVDHRDVVIMRYRAVRK